VRVKHPSYPPIAIPAQAGIPLHGLQAIQGLGPGLRRDDACFAVGQGIQSPTAACCRSKALPRKIHAAWYVPEPGTKSIPRSAPSDRFIVLV
jgi:hypothetical protein